MTSQSVEDVVDSAAVAIVCDLERDGFRVELAPDDAIVITPKLGLTADRRQQVVDHKAAIKTLLRGRDAGVADRVAEFRRQFDIAPVPTVPAFLFKVGIYYTKGQCFSCGDPLPELRFGRCWRCGVAWRVACRLPVPALLAEAMDTARVSA